MLFNTPQPTTLPIFFFLHIFASDVLARYVRHIPWHLKQRLIKELQPMLAEWSGYDHDELQVCWCDYLLSVVVDSGDPFKQRTTFLLLSLRQRCLKCDFLYF